MRRLLVVSGESEWCAQQALRLRRALPGDWLWVGTGAPVKPWCAPRALVTLLGREFYHAIFDARDGFDASAFAALGGTLLAGSWLVLLTPPFSDWEQRPDADSLRWSDCPEPVAVPCFARHCCQIIEDDADTLVWRQHQPLLLPDFPPLARWYPASGEPGAEQALILDELARMAPGVAVLTAARGRGKSALAGLHIRQPGVTALVTAPLQAATAVMARFAGSRFQFMAPDALLAKDVRADWLIVDEAAAIPGPLLQKLVARFPRALLITTTQGYEGTGRGFLLKFCARFPGLRSFTLRHPVRWAAGCPLEKVIDDLLLLRDQAFDAIPRGAIRLASLEQEAWFTRPELPQALYQLLCTAHYRTSPLDLRRMMDAPGQHFIQAVAGQQLAGALWLVDEGGLSPALSRAVWAGIRRPRGNLVAQSLAAHGVDPLAATLKGCRISRIAVHPARQRQGIGQRLVQQAREQNQHCDYLSVSFGYSAELWRFWRRCGFLLVRIGSHREASSGCYTAMALLPVSAAGKALAHRQQARLCRDVGIIEQRNGEKIPLRPVPQPVLDNDDWLDLAGFAFARRPLAASLGSLGRLLQASALPLPALRGVLEAGDSDSERCARLRLNGRKGLLASQRKEAAQALDGLDVKRRQILEAQISRWQLCL